MFASCVPWDRRFVEPGAWAAWQPADDVLGVKLKCVLNSVELIFWGGLNTHRW